MTKDLITENIKLKREVIRLRRLCEVKDAFFKELMSDSLRCGSKLGAKHMFERKQYIKGK